MHSEKTLRAIQTVNEAARQQARNARVFYGGGVHKQAKTARAKKKALYRVKLEALRTLLEDADRAERHEVDGRSYTCLFFGEVFFYQRVGSLHLTDDEIDAWRTLEDFQTLDLAGPEMDLNAALDHLKEKLGVEWQKIADGEAKPRRLPTPFDLNARLSL